jgi:hypothetical protein
LQATAKTYDFDPLTAIAIIHSESGFDAESVSRDGEDYGLAQLRARYLGDCKRDRDPVQDPTPECLAFKRSLLDPEMNIRAMGQLISQNRKFCKKKTGSAAFERWLASYQGRNFPKQRRYCKPGEKTWSVIRYRQALLDRLARTKIKSHLN